MKYFDDIEKIRDLIIMEKDDFLSSYSYLNDEDYEDYKKQLDYFKNNYQLKLLNVEKDSNGDFSILIKEELTDKTFWLDCYEDEQEKGYYSWEFNKYIFYLYNSIDLEDKLLQEIFMSEDVLEGFDCEVDCLIREAIEKGGILNESDK